MSVHNILGRDVTGGAAGVGEGCQCYLCVVYLLHTADGWHTELAAERVLPCEDLYHSPEEEGGGEG